MESTVFGKQHETLFASQLVQKPKPYSLHHVSLMFYLPFVSFFALMNAHFPCERNQLVDK